jgi:hypothetical protein
MDRERKEKEEAQAKKVTHPFLMLSLWFVIAKFLDIVTSVVGVSIFDGAEMNVLGYEFVIVGNLIIISFMLLIIFSHTDDGIRAFEKSKHYGFFMNFMCAMVILQFIVDILNIIFIIIFGL